jgi:NAD(P)H dehydrogenase (quinone)
MVGPCMNTLQCIGEVFDVPNLDREPGKIFITGGSGAIGNRIANKLIDTGYVRVRVGTAIKNSLTDMSERGAEVVDFSWNREETYANALIGIKSIIITIPYEKNWHKHFSVFLNACKKANVKHYVKLSFYLSLVPAACQVPFVRHHTSCDNMMMNMVFSNFQHLSQMSFTIISSSHYMSNQTMYHNKDLSSILASSKIYRASNCCAANYISPNDVTEATVRIILSPQNHYNRIYTLLGPDLIIYQDIARLMSKFFGKNITYVDVSSNEYRNILLDWNIPRWLVKDLVAMQHVLASGFEEKISKYMRNDFEMICGHPPETFQDYLTCTTTMTQLEVGSVTDEKKCFSFEPTLFEV